MACIETFHNREDLSPSDFWDQLIRISEQDDAQTCSLTSSHEDEEFEDESEEHEEDKEDEEDEENEEDEEDESEGGEEENTSEGSDDQQEEDLPEAFTAPSESLARLLRTHGVPAGEEVHFLQVF